MSVNVPGYKSSAVFEALKSKIEANPKDPMSKAKGIFEFRIKNPEGNEQVWTMDLKKNGTVQIGPGKEKPDIVLTMADNTFVDLYSGKLNGPKALILGKLKVKGNLALAGKLDGLLKLLKPKS
ncbi:hypothetical protein G9A89_017034 [Geosiphon pyriformis]|nr:hypothetical protein G9A89_017034 [Geosiphon pyriformis]